MDMLIPEEFFETLGTIWLAIIGTASLWLLAKGADWLVDGASELAGRLGIPKVVIGATIVSLGTTMPECAVSVMAAWEGNAGLALGNSVGSVIFDTAVIFGAGCLLARLPADRTLLRRQGWIQFGSAALLATFCYWQVYRFGDAAQVPNWFGFVLLGLLALYLWVSIYWTRNQSTVPPGEPPREDVVFRSTGYILLRMFAGLIGVLIGSRITIICVTIIARRMNIPEVVISATLVAFGTSLPECIVGLMALRRGHPELLVGNVVGADILNILFVTGAAAAAKSLPIVATDANFPYIFLQLHLPVMLLALTYFRVCIAASVSRGEFRRWMGLPLILVYVVFNVLSFLWS